MAGLVLQLWAGPVDWNVFRWPVNGIVTAGFLTAIAAMFLLRKRVRGFRFLCTHQAAIPAMVCAVVLTIVMGLTRQTDGEEGTWLNSMLRFWPFVLVYALMATILGMVTVRRMAGCRWTRSSLKRDVPFVLNHAGLLIAMTTATLGHADMERLKMMAVAGEPEWRALTDEGTVRELPMTISLKRFIMETYDDGSPKRFASEIEVLTRSGKHIQATVDVNRPVAVEGWKIYQYGYDTLTGGMSQMSVLEIVSDPWLPLVYAGIYMMLCGAVCMLVVKREKVKR